MERVMILLKHQVIPFDRTKRFYKACAICIGLAVLFISLNFSESVFAEKTDMSFEVTDTYLPEEQLIKLLMTDVPSVVNNEQAKDDSWKAVRMRVTAYCPCSSCCGEYSDGITADNHRIQDGDRFVAADNVYAFGTEMIIPGYNESQSVEVKDRGGAIKNNRLDVFFNTHEEALAWGVQHLYVLIKIQ